jgi:hypothetical protein
MSDELGIFPFQGHGQDRIFLARFEFPKWPWEFQISKGAWRALPKGGEAPPSEGDKPLGFIHFLAGFPIDTIEMLMLIGQYSSKPPKGSEIVVMPGSGATAPIPDFFEWPDETRLLLNVTALLEDPSLFFAENLPGEPEPSKPKWWFRAEVPELEADEGGTVPVPGEFLALGVRMMPGEFWGHQRSSPFIYSGFFADTLYLSGARVIEVIEPDGTYPFCRYSIQWRKDVFTAIPSDFCEYKPEDRVSVLKDCATTEISQTWKSTSQYTWDESKNWQIVPFSFYGLEAEEE